MLFWYENTAASLCPSDPCADAMCANFPNAECVPDFCTCTATFPGGETNEIDLAPLCDSCNNFEETGSIFGECDFPLGIALVQGQCTLVSGCESFGFPFFESVEACQECLCVGVESAVIFGPCEAILGATVVNGQCQVVSGCSQMGVPFFDSIEDCQSQCGCSGTN